MAARGAPAQPFQAVGGDEDARMHASQFGAQRGRVGGHQRLQGMRTGHGLAPAGAERLALVLRQRVLQGQRRQ
jgi:hypothetical protein